MGMDFADAGRSEDCTASELLMKDLIELRDWTSSTAEKKILRRAIKRIEFLEKSLSKIAVDASCARYPDRR